jgi:hypothetical protein
MANILWTVNTGHNLGTFPESTVQTINLPVVADVEQLNLISGKLPPGLRIENFSLVGTPFEVKELKTFTFCLRAKKGYRVEDLTLNITIDGADEPIWITPEGDLPLGPNNRFYILDSSPVDFQLQLIDADLPAGDTIEYILEDDGGELPPGIELGRTTGKLTGIVEPLLALEKRANAGFYDTNVYGTFPFDFGVKSFNGFESFYYDTTFYDFAVPTQSPKKLNRFYQFTVAASDGITITKRKFQIYLVGDDFLRTDNTIMQLGTGLFTADNTYLRAPIWLTPSDLGFRRANNFMTLFLDVYDPTSNQGIISFTVKESNPDGTPSVLPPGTEIDSTTGEIAGRVPYQPAVTKEYKFTIEALRQIGSSTTTTSSFFANNIGQGPWAQLSDTVLPNDPGYPDADNFSLTDFAENNFKTNENQTAWMAFTEAPVNDADAGQDSLRNKDYVAQDIIGKKIFIVENGKVVASSENLGVTKVERSNIDYNRGQFIGTIAEALIRTYDDLGNVTSTKSVTVTFYNYEKRVTSEVNPTVAKDKTFTVKLLGEVESAITWNTDSDLGNVRANFVSTLRVNASSNVPDAVVLYRLKSGRLPPGITLAIDGQLQGKIRQFGEPGKPGLTYIDKADTITTFDGDTTTFDRSYEFTVEAQDQFNFSAREKTFEITTTDPSDILYSSISMKPLLNKEQRNLYRNFISDPTIFNPSGIYRPNDETFGLQPTMSILTYAGIETKEIDKYVAAVAKNHKRKRFKLGDVKKAIAKNVGSNEVVYEIIYVDVIDPSEPSSGKTAKQFITQTKNKVTVDSVQYSVTDDNSGLGTGQGFFNIGLRGGDGRSPANVGTITFYTRQGQVLYAPGGSISLFLQNGQEITVADIDDSINADPYRFRPINDTIKIDSDAIVVSDANDQRKYISNITNMRERIRDVGNNLREFYPLWMRTPQNQGEPELGFVLAVPLCYCLPGEADNIILNIQNSEFDFKQLNIEIERYNIDSTEGNSSEQYIKFANYQFNV